MNLIVLQISCLFREGCRQKQMKSNATQKPLHLTSNLHPPTVCSRVVNILRRWRLSATVTLVKSVVIIVDNTLSTPGRLACGAAGRRLCCRFQPSPTRRTTSTQQLGTITAFHMFHLRLPSPYFSFPPSREKNKKIALVAAAVVMVFVLWRGNGVYSPSRPR